MKCGIRNVCSDGGGPKSIGLSHRVVESRHLTYMHQELLLFYCRSRDVAVKMSTIQNGCDYDGCRYMYDYVGIDLYSRFFLLDAQL